MAVEQITNCKIKQPKNIVVKIEYKPNMKRMVKALKTLLEYVPENEELDKKRSAISV